MALKYGGTGVPPGLRGLGTNWNYLQAGQCATVPSGTWVARLSKYLTYQELDEVSGIWRSPGGSVAFGGAAAVQYINSDGVNFRIANQTGCVVGGYPTTAGSGYSSPPVCTPSSGNAVFQSIIGGAVGATVTVSNGGSSYVYPPQVVFAAPPSPGLQATGYATLSGGVVTAVTMIGQGAGYSSAPQIAFYNDPRDVTGYGAQAQCVLTGAGTLTGLVATDFGNTLTAFTAIPTLAFSGGGGSSAAATAIVAACLTSFTITTAGVALSATGGVYVTAPLTGFPATASVLLNPAHQSDLVRTRPALIIPTIAAGAVSAVGTVQDGGIYSGVNVLLMAISNNAPTTNPSLTAPVFSGLGGAYGLFAA